MSHHDYGPILKGALRNVLVNSPVIFGLLVIFMSEEPISDRRMALAAFIMGLAGIVQVILKEVPGAFFSIRGKPAVVLGIVFTGMLWGVSALCMVWYALE